MSASHDESFFTQVSNKLISKKKKVKAQVHRKTHACICKLSNLRLEKNCEQISMASEMTSAMPDNIKMSGPALRSTSGHWTTYPYSFSFFSIFNGLETQEMFPLTNHTSYCGQY